ncbi:MAG: DUF302 domain-containing protein [Steroidobacteraceae bacterium]
MKNQYGFGKVINLPFAAAIDRVTHALQDEGFGVLTDIDVAATLKKKLDKTVPPYRILGACNPTLASQALDNEPSIGLLLPCNVVVRQDARAQVHVEFMDPVAILDLVDNPNVELLAAEVRRKLERVLQSLEPDRLSRSA